MIPAAFDYHAPGSLAEAIELLGKYGDAKVLSGGQSLLPLLKLRMGSAAHLVDINRVPGLEYIREEGGFLRIGGRTRESALEESDLIRKKYPILSDTARVIADPIVRNLATIGGNLAHGDPANDHPATMLAVRAVVVATASVGMSALSGSRALTMSAWLVLLIIPHVLALIVDAIADWPWLYVLSIWALLSRVGDALFKVESESQLGVWHALPILALYAAGGMAIAWRRIKNAEVIV